jgi:hypothetical protein
MAEKVPNPKFQMIPSAPASLSATLAALPSVSLPPLAPFPSNPQFSNPNHAEAERSRLLSIAAWEFSPLALPWSLGFGIWCFLILN